MSHSKYKKKDDAYRDRPLPSRLRELGFKLAMAEMYGTRKGTDLSGMKAAHEGMLRELYRKGGK